MSIVSRRRKLSKASTSLVQALESRRLLAAVSWDGGAGTLAWTDAANWSGDVVPTAGDDVTIDIPADITVTITSGAQSVNSLSCAEGLAVSAGSLAVATASSVAGPFTLSGTGALAGAGDLTLNGASTWSQGSMAGSGATIIGAAGTLAIPGSSNLALQRNLTNIGIINWSGSADLLMTNSTITNTGTINHTNSGTSIYQNTSGTNQIINHGSINRVTVGTAQSAVAMANNGTIAATLGTFTISGGLSHNGTITNSSATINFNSNATYAPASTVTGAGVFLFSSGTHTLEPTRYAPAGMTTIQGSASVTLNVLTGQLNPTISGTAVFNVPLTLNNASINATATFNQPVTFTGTAALGGNVNFNSTVNTSFTSLQITTGTTTFPSAAALSVDSLTLGGTLSTPANLTINTAGTISGGGLVGGGTVFIPASVTVAVTGGSTTIAKNIDNDGTFNMSSGGDLSFSGATFNNDGTLTLSGSGADINFTSGTNELINNAQINKNAANGSTIRIPVTNNATITQSAGTLALLPTGGGTALANNGTMTLASGAVLQIGSLVSGPASSLSGGGAVTFLTGGTSTLSPGRFSTAGDLTFAGGTVVVDVVRVQAAATAISGDVTFNQPVTFNAAVTIPGTADFTNTATFATTLGIAGTATFSANGNFGGAVSVTGRLNVDTVAPGLSIPTVAISSGVLGGTGLLVVTTTLTTNGNMTMDGTGMTRLASGATLPSVGNAWGINSGYTFHNQGTVTMGSDNPDIYLNDSTFLNDGVLQSVNGTSIDTITNSGGTCLFINNGTILKTVGGTSALLSIEVPLQHNGLINVGPGTINLSGTGSTYSASSTTAGSGNINFSGGTHTFLGATTLNGIGTTGIPFFTGGTAIFTVDTTINNAGFGGSTIEGPGTLSLGNGSEVYGGTFSTTGGGRLRVPAGSTAALTGGNPVFARPFDIFGTFQMSSGGDLNVLDTVVTIENTGILHFNTTAGGSDVEYASGATSGSLINKGTVLRDSTGSASIDVRFDNHGLVDINGGSLGINGGFADGTYTRTTGIYDVQTGSLGFGTVNTNGAEIIFRTGSSVSGLVNLQFNDGKLDLRDGVDLFFDPFAAQGNTMYNRGQIELSPGSVLTVAAGNNLFFAGTGNATVRSEIAGPTDAEYGRLFVGGQLRLTSPDGGDSQFDPDLVGGYDPVTGTRFNIVTAGSIVDSFDDFFGATTPSGLILLASKSATQYYAEVGTGTSPTPPQILSSAFEFETHEAIVLTFNTDVSAFISRRDLKLFNLTTSTTISPDIGTLTYDAGTNTATYTFTSLIPNGDYQLSITADDIANAAGVPLTTPLTLDFFILRGDANRDRSVNFDDLLIVAQNYGQTGRTFSQGNLNYSAGGLVNFDDLLIMAQQYGTSLLKPDAVTDRRLKRSGTHSVL